MDQKKFTAAILLLGSLMLAACQREPGLPQQSSSSERDSAGSEENLRIVTLLPRDAIPAIDNPSFLSVTEADLEYDPDELVLGVSFNGEARAYSVPLLSGHEIVNDTVGGVKIAVTW